MGLDGRRTPDLATERGSARPGAPAAFSVLRPRLPKRGPLGLQRTRIVSASGFRRAALNQPSRAESPRWRGQTPVCGNRIPPAAEASNSTSVTVPRYPGRICLGLRSAAPPRQGGPTQCWSSRCIFVHTTIWISNGKTECFVCRGHVAMSHGMLGLATCERQPSNADTGEENDGECHGSSPWHSRRRRTFLQRWARVSERYCAIRRPNIVPLCFVLGGLVPWWLVSCWWCTTVRASREFGSGSTGMTGRVGCRISLGHMVAVLSQLVVT